MIGGGNGERSASFMASMAAGGVKRVKNLFFRGDNKLELGGFHPHRTDQEVLSVSASVRVWNR